MTDYKDNSWQCDKCADKDREIAELKKEVEQLKSFQKKPFNIINEQQKWEKGK